MHGQDKSMTEKWASNSWASALYLTEVSWEISIYFLTNFISALFNSPPQQVEPESTECYSCYPKSTQFEKPNLNLKDPTKI
jgi:hypothetical protein